jgi:HNH endonuclease
MRQPTPESTESLLTWNSRHLELDDRIAQLGALQEQVRTLTEEIQLAQISANAFAPGGTGSIDERFWRKIHIVDDPDSCWPFIGSNRNKPNENYGNFGIGGKTYLAHRVAFALASGISLDELPEAVRHTCDNPPCCRPAHLIAGTQLDNIEDRVRRNRSGTKGDQRGEANDSAVLTDAIVIAARRRYREGASCPALAREWGLAEGTLRGAIMGYTWQHLNEIEPPATGRPNGSHLVDDDVRSIRARSMAGESYAAIAADYGVGRSNIMAIVKRKSWKHVE